MFIINVLIPYQIRRGGRKQKKRGGARYKLQFLTRTRLWATSIKNAPFGAVHFNLLIHPDSSQVKHVYRFLSIGTHEVAFSTLPRRNGDIATHSIVVDHLIHDFPDVLNWVRGHGGGIFEDRYKSALSRSVSVHFPGSFEDALEFLRLDGVRRALIAYWVEALIILKERQSSSFFAKHHNWNAVAEIRKRIIMKT